MLDAVAARLAASLHDESGAVRVEGERAGQAVSGSGYVEMTGYAGSMQGQF